MTYTVGDKYQESFVISEEVVAKFAEFSQDYNPIHMDGDFAKSHGYARRVAHGIIQLSYISKVIGMDFPGKGAMWTNQTINWLSPVFINDEINVILTIKEYSESVNLLTLITEIFNQNGQKLMTGLAQVKMTTAISVNLQKSIKPSNVVNFEKILPQRKILDKKVALVTGASRGIGGEIVRKLAQENYAVIVNYKNNKNMADNIANVIISAGGEAISICADMSNEIEVKSMSETILEKWGRCDIVIHGASPAINPIKAEEINYKDVNAYLEIYLKGAISLVNLFSPCMKDNNFGRFIFIGSSYLYGTPPKGMAAYVSAKEALWGYTKALSGEIAHNGITVNMVSPSMAITDLTNNIPARIKEVEAFKNPTKRLVTTADIASQVVHLCSTGSSYINGINLPITATPV
jgi:3-oxoacyl-[acyl-carrier protein] reductase